MEYNISKTGFRRLYKLCDFMASLPKSANKHFHMRDFFEHKGADHQHSLPNEPTKQDLHACGTTACALGWAVTVPAFRRAGLYVSANESFIHEGKWYSVEGSCEAFGLPEGDHEWDKLFGSENKDKTPKAWAKRVRKLLKKWQAA